MYSPQAKVMAEKLRLTMGRANLEEFADTLLTIARTNRNVLAVTSDSRGSGKLGPFAQALPDQIVELGIAEQNLVGVAAGLSSAGKLVFAVSPACFLTARALEQVKNDVAYSEMPVKLVGISAGVSYGALGSTHHSLHDLAALRAINNIDIVVPADNFETREIIRQSAGRKIPTYIRFGKAPIFNLSAANPSFELGKSRTLREGTDVAFIATGETVIHALLAAGALHESGLSARVISMHTIKPLDLQTVIKAGRECRALITVEEHSVFGGLGEACAATLMQAAISLPFQIAAFPDEHTVTGSQADIFRHYGISMEGLAGRAQTLLRHNTQ
ncbi:MAG: transketolase family protein [Planctomycetota bacterium]|nr:transketolase family protein [Planctomycetota bacterium]